ncbi:MAG: hypothetical protein IJL98_02870 [Lachnospiraceae bacterium]|nr:hypothetical protein [Lachnospiraceae bacterium]MBR0086664.1 hypothetical protein [Lachnospiraceae bacterium]
MKNPVLLARILIVLLVLNAVFMIVSLFMGNLSLFYIGGAILVVLVILSTTLIQVMKKQLKEKEEETEEP